MIGGKSFAVVLFSRLLLSQKYQEKDSAQNDLHKRRSRRGKTYVKQRNFGSSAHKPRYGKSYAECSDNSLNHNECGAAAAVEISDKTE